MGTDMGERLRQARKAKYKSGRAAALAMGVPFSTYAAHENGQNEFDTEAAQRYARRFGVSAAWLLTGEPELGLGQAPLVGYVGAGAEAHFYAEADDPGEFVTAPDGSTPHTVAVQIRGVSVGSLYDGWLVFYDRVESPVTPTVYYRMCVVGLADGRVLVKRLEPSKTEGLYHLISDEPPILDVAVEWAAPVRAMVQPR